ncbi:MAG TPA: D-alanyl-D-alanine carboxypeptidase family protein [Caulobacterales bacterium]|nr:D-alanyl-D-alanine carboxypeptidase family protein [Caulobacterales bacterium]
MRYLAFFASVCLAATGAFAQAPAFDPVPTPAQHVAILDYKSGQLLYCKDCETPMPPASMSKLMTVLVVADKLKSGAIKWDTQLPVSENAWRHGAQSDGSHMFLEINSTASVRDLLSGVVIVSANDACIALAEGIAGSEENFVQLMNARGQQLGLKSAHFANVTGLPDPTHVISSADLARLSRFITQTYPEIYKLDSQPSFTYNKHTQENRNPLLGVFEGADGVKTGHTSDSGYGMIGSALRGGERRIVVFNGLSSMAARRQEGLRLMGLAFASFEAKRLFEKGAPVGEAQVWLGAKKTVKLQATAPFDVAYLRTAKDGLKTSIVYEGPVSAPIKKGDIIAKLVFEGPGVARQEMPLAAGENVGGLNPISKALVGAKQMFGGS